MGWANDAFANELAMAGIFPISEGKYEKLTDADIEKNRREEKDRLAREFRELKREKKERKINYCAYDFPTEAQVRALRFITMNTGIVFIGKTKDQARIFINKNIDYARECANKR